MPRTADKQLEGRIVDAAYQLWSQGGQHALTMRAVARAARTTTPTLYERFKDKHQLLAFMRARATQRAFSSLLPAKCAAEVCELALKFTSVNGNEYLLLASDWALRLKRREPLPFYTFLKAKLGYDLGGPPENYARLAMSLLSMVHGAAMFLLAEGIDERVSKEVRGACLDACRFLIDHARHGFDGKVRDPELGL